MPSTAPPILTTMSWTALNNAREALRDGSAGEELQSARDTLVARGRTLAALAPVAVTDKPDPGPSGQTRDFYAIGKYAWPDPERPDGLPYLRRDCLINPESNSDRYDKARYDEMVERVRVLALGAFIGDDAELGEAAAAVLRTWFVDPATSMTPHLRHAAVLPGVNDGAAIGIIEGAVLVEVLDHVRLLEADGHWCGTDRDGLRAWMAGYAGWLRTSEFGTAEGRMVNNHGSFWLAQVAAAAGYAGTATPELVDDLAKLGRTHLEHQLGADGSLPEEMARPDAWPYATYGLRALATEAQVLASLGVDQWAHETSDGRSLRLAYEFLLPYLGGAEWPYARLDQVEDNHAGDHAIAAARMGAIGLADRRVADAHRSLAATGEPRHVVLAGDVRRGVAA
ncbi:alginate lyase family protein [Occultella gossypii]|uniref:Alginate lyase family protein n=1 Tax=Occultella gossypii TaxID=2800820 RepID=A0ABS7SB26_9MICO|nr:alginate lyase family protein [Occultella gossypii]MBZ2197390.1 alginate lyase family protein [Occultella gossypii]